MEEPSSRVREVPRRSSLATRSAALYSVLVGAAVLLAGWLIHAGDRDEVLEGRERDLEHRARTVQVRIETEVRAVANDVLFLARAPFLRRLADSWNPENRPHELVSDVQATFSALLEGKPSYAQTRLLQLSGQGRELIRLDHVGDEVVASPPDALQAKGHRDYFRESSNLQPNEVYLSSINLNREFGEVSIPHTPTLRAAAKVFDSAGRPFGLVVINVDLRRLFSELQATAGEEASLYITNAEGDYLGHPDSSRTFGFDLGRRHRISDDFGADPIRRPQSDREIVRFVRSSLWETAGRDLLIGVGIARESVLSELAAIRNRGLAVALVAALLAAALVWALAFLLSRRLVKLADAIGHYEPGGGAPVLPERGSDEVAVVARKFTLLSAKIDEQVQALERAREVADENRRAKEEFLATLSHEIRTPMNAVTGLLHSLKTDRPAKHQLPVIQTLQFASRKLIAVVNDVLDFSKIEAGQITFERAPFDLQELLASVRTGHLPQARDGGVELVCELDDDTPSLVSGDSLRLYQVLNNLVQNALKFTKRGGKVAVRVQPQAGGTDGFVPLSFCVEDTGVGMTPEELERALSRFGQAQPGAAHKFGGTGLGLPIARMLVELQGGSFEAFSTPGNGSRFQFQLEFDAVPEDTDLLSAPLQTAPDLEGIRILCVEDVASNRQVVSALLDPCRARVDFATSAEDALGILEHGADENLPDLILLDLQLPDRDGASLAMDIRCRWPGIPVVGLTAQTAGSLLERCKKAGVRTFLWKPIDPEVFFQTVARAVNEETGRGAEALNGADSQPHSDGASVLKLFDGDTEQTNRYLLTLATELDTAAVALASLVAGNDHEGLRELYHRLQNGLTLTKATSVMQAIDRLSELLSEDPSAAKKRVADCQDLLAETAAKLREQAPEETAESRP